MAASCAFDSPETVATKNSRSAHFAPLMDDAETFAKAAIVEDGLGVAWPVRTKWGSLDVSASTLRRIVQEQQPNHVRPQ
jgi:hypothetical protein